MRDVTLVILNSLRIKCHIRRPLSEAQFSRLTLNTRSRSKWRSHTCISVPARLGKGQGAKEIGHNRAREQQKFGHNLVRKRHKIGHTFTRERPTFGLVSD